MQERKALGNSGGSGSRGAGPKISARLAGEGGGGESGSGGRSRRLAAGTSSTRKGVAGGGGRSGRSAPGKRRGAVEIAPAWGQENENALEALKSASRVVRARNGGICFLWYFICPFACWWLLVLQQPGGVRRAS